MSNVTGTIRGRLQESQSPTIYNVSVSLANTEMSQALSDNTRSFLIRVRGAATLKLAFEPGETLTNYLTLPPGSSYSTTGLNFSGSLYFQTSKPSQIVEILEWT